MVILSLIYTYRFLVYLNLVRVCTERGQSGSGASEPEDHQPKHGEGDKSLTAGVDALKIARES